LAPSPANPGHDFRLNDEVQVLRFMNMTGG
jgi:hypothetical protein